MLWESHTGFGMLAKPTNWLNTYSFLSPYVERGKGRGEKGREGNEQPRNVESCSNCLETVTSTVHRQLAVQTETAHKKLLRTHLSIDLTS